MKVAKNVWVEKIEEVKPKVEVIKRDDKREIKISVELK